MLLAIDIGNSFVKWEYCAASGGRGVQRAPLADVLAAPARYFTERPGVVAIANVAGDTPRAALSALCASWQAPVHWIATQTKQCGVRNGYAQPEQLGVDRWLALIAARADTSGPCVVASVGTALTADMLAANGDFLGGIIVPGPELMRAALTRGTAAVAPAPGQCVDFPRNTADAVESGIMQALSGAIEQAVATLARTSSADVALLLTGGAAAGVSRCLNTPHRVVDNLPLQGLRIIAQQEGWL